MSFDDVIESVLQDEEVLKALRRRAEETAEWLEHKRWHDEDPTHRGEAVLEASWDISQTESIERPVEQAFEDEPVRKRTPHSLWAGCTCKSPTLKLLFGEDGGITNELPQVIETNAYGVVAADTAVSYLGSNPGGGVEYQPGTGTQTSPYSNPSSSNNSLYK